MTTTPRTGKAPPLPAEVLARHAPYKAPKPDRPTCAFVLGPNGVKVAVMSDDGPTPEHAAKHRSIDDDMYEKVPGKKKEELRRVRRVLSDLELMRDKGQIDERQLAAGKTFRDEFEIAGMDPLKAANLHRMGGGQVSDIPARIMDAKDYVADCMKRAGGHGSFTGLALWWVVGRGESFAEFTRRVAWGNNTRLRQEAVPALVQSVLSILCEPKR